MSEKLDQFRMSRAETIRLVEPLSQAEIDGAQEGKWSIGEVLDHLAKSDSTYLKVIDQLVDLKREGKKPQIVVTLAKMEFSFPLLPKPLLPFADLPVAVFNYFLPNSARELIVRNPVVPAESPPVLRPEAGKEKAQLVDALERSLDRTERIFSDNPGMNFSEFRFYHPLFGFNDVYDIIGLMLSHERRHQKQLHRLIDGLQSAAEPAPDAVGAESSG
jgi:hypothetical protein